MRFTLQPIHEGGPVVLCADGIQVPGQTSVSIEHDFNSLTTLTIEFAMYSGGIEHVAEPVSRKEVVEEVVVAEPEKEAQTTRRRIRLRRAEREAENLQHGAHIEVDTRQDKPTETRPSTLTFTELEFIQARISDASLRDIEEFFVVGAPTSDGSQPVGFLPSASSVYRPRGEGHQGDQHPVQPRDE